MTVIVVIVFVVVMILIAKIMMIITSSTPKLEEKLEKIRTQADKQEQDSKTLLC
jgi:flagellar biosynthesis/type III secretory pathway M-ring protein FliF/YscJ